jgi:signal peptidase I
MDFETLFTVLLLVSGLIVLADRIVLAPRRRAASGSAAREPRVVEYAAAFLPVVLIVLIIRSFVFEPFRIPSASMMPGLIDGDFIFVSKFSYGLRLPVVNTKIVSTGSPRRGDVIVFRLPSNPSIDYIKRLIGLPGDHVVVRENRISINGREFPLAAAGTYAGGPEFTGAELERERTDGREHLIMIAPQRRATDYDAIVPEGHYFFMGDNRNDSEDSRFDAVGFVPEANLVGRATLIWLNWAFPSSPRWGRIGTRIR